MNTIIKTIIGGNNDSVLKQAAQIIINGGLVAFPTETVYGLGANAFNAEAANKIYKAKNRPADNPLIVHIQSIEEIEDVVSHISTKAKIAINNFWPGPLTLILNKNEKIPDAVTCGLPTVAVRMPGNIVARNLIKASKTPIAAPSANSSGKPSPTKANHVYEDLNGKIELIIDGGDCDIGLESTILDLTVNTPVILRPGGITKKMLTEVLGEVEEASNSHIDNFKPKAPGMKYTHYSPLADVIVVEGELSRVVSKINTLSNSSIEKGKRVGILATTQTMLSYKHGIAINVGSRANTNEIAVNLFSSMREFDRLCVDIIYAESLPYDEIGNAVMNRLLKASGYQVITV